MRTALPDLRAYARQMHRWMLFARLLLRSQSWPTRLRIAAGQGLSALLPAAALTVFAMAPSWPAAVVITIGATAHLYGRRALQRACAGSGARIGPRASPAGALPRPLPLLPGVVGTPVRWREHHYRVFANDRFEEIP